MIATANAMFGPGFVWLVQKQDRQGAKTFHILCTYLAGTPLSKAHYREQSLDMGVQNAESVRQFSSEEDRIRQTQVQNRVGAAGTYSAQGGRNIALGGVNIVPVLCVNTWEHVWLRDYLIGGKKAFLERWWRRIDWTKPNRAAEAARSPMGMNQFRGA